MYLYITLSAIFNAVVSTLLAVFILCKNFSNNVNRTFAFFCISVATWSYPYIGWTIAHEADSALFWFQVEHIGAAFTVITYFHFVVTWLNIKSPNITRILRFGYLIACFYIFASFSPHFITGVVPKYSMRYYLNPGILYHIFLVYFFYYAFYSTYLLVKHFVRATGIKRNQIKFILIGMPLSFIGGSSNYFLCYDINIPPFGNILASSYVIATFYAIVTYRLMDIRIAVTSVSIFIITYALTLGAPFYLYAEGYHFVSLITAIILATVAPFTYIYIQRRAAARLLAEQRAYQETLRQASSGMGRVRDLKKLLNLIVSILTRAVRMEHAFIYILDSPSGRYRLAALRRSHSAGMMVKPELPEVSMIVEAFNKISDPLVLEEIRNRAADSQDPYLDGLAAEMTEYLAAVIVPIYSRADLIAVVVMGKKDRNRLYTEDDLSTFAILANQAALAIENANYYDDMRRTQEQLFQAEKLATVGTMADGLSHQVNNRFHALGFIAGDLMDTIKQYEKDPSRFAITDVFGQIKSGLDRIEENVIQGGQVVKGLLDYSRSKTAEKGPIDLNKLLKASLDMVGLKVRLSDLSWEVDIPADIPPVSGHFVQLQEVFFNIIDNAHHSMMEKKNSGVINGYQPHMTFKARLVERRVHIVITDNGMGVRPEDQRKLFMPFFTTKVSSRSGNGLGLFVMRKIIEEGHGGTITFISEYTQGVEIKIILPVMNV